MLPGALGERPTSARGSAPACASSPRPLLAVLAAGARGLRRRRLDPAAERQRARPASSRSRSPTSKFPTEQRLAQTSDLILGVENTGDEPLPELAFTIETDDGDGRRLLRGPRSTTRQPPNPNRPVWILENKYPRDVGTRPPTGISGGLRAQTNTFGFGPLEPGDERTIVWRVTAVKAGTYTLHYRSRRDSTGTPRPSPPTAER